MPSPILHINTITAKGLDLKEMISCCSNNKGVYADVFISGSNKSAKQKTPIDKIGGTNPSWKFPMMFSTDVDVPESHQTFVVKLKVVGFLSDKVIGEVHVPMVALLKVYVDRKAENRMSCSVMTPGGHKGALDIDFEFKELTAYAGGTRGHRCRWRTSWEALTPRRWGRFWSVTKIGPIIGGTNASGADHQTAPAPAPAAQKQNPSKFRNVAAWIGAGAGVTNAFIGIFAS